MKTFTKNMDLLKDVVTASNMNEIGNAVRRIDALDNAFKSGELASEFVSGVIRVFSTVAIPRWSAVSIKSAAGITPESEMSAAEALRPVMMCQKWTEADAGSPWGVLLDPVSPGSVSRMLISEVVVCKLRHTAGHGYAAPSNDGLESTASSTTVKILWASDDAGDDGRKWAVVQIGSVGAITSTSSVPCRINGGSSADGYAVTIFANGIGEAYTGTGTLYILKIAGTANLDAGAYVLGWPSVTLTTGGNEPNV